MLLPDRLKIDQTFVRDSTTDTDDDAFVYAVIGLWKSLRQRVIAKGMETASSSPSSRRISAMRGKAHFRRPVVAAEFALSLGRLWRPPFNRCG